MTHHQVKESLFHWSLVVGDVIHASRTILEPLVVSCLFNVDCYCSLWSFCEILTYSSLLTYLWHVTFWFGLYFNTIFMPWRMSWSRMLEKETTELSPSINKRECSSSWEEHSKSGVRHLNFILLGDKVGERLFLFLKTCVVSIVYFTSDWKVRVSGRRRVTSWFSISRVRAVVSSYNCLFVCLTLFYSVQTPLFCHFHSRRRMKKMDQVSLYTLLLVFTIFLSSTTASQEVMSFTGPGSGSGRGMWGKINSRLIPLSRRMDCVVFCRKTGFSGYVGGCQCGFTLFTKKSLPALGFSGSMMETEEEVDQPVAPHLPLSFMLSQIPHHSQSPVGSSSSASSASLRAHLPVTSSTRTSQKQPQEQLSSKDISSGPMEQFYD